MTSLMVALIQHEPWSGADSTGQTPESRTQMKAEATRCFVGILFSQAGTLLDSDPARVGGPLKDGKRDPRASSKQIRLCFIVAPCLPASRRALGKAFVAGMLILLKPKRSSSLQDKEWFFKCRLWRGRYDRTFKWLGSSKLSGHESHVFAPLLR